MACLLGIDVGTSGTKTLLTDEEGTILASAMEEHPISSPRPLWSEQDPGGWWQATAASIRRVLSDANVRGETVTGLGLSGQMHGSVFLDKEHQVLRPAILWNDQRTARECAEITETIGAARLIELVSNPALTGFTAPKILWVRKNEPEIYEKTKKILLPKDYVRFRLTGEFATEVSDASGTLLLDVRRREWSVPVLDALDIDQALLPECYESPVVSGRVSELAAGETGLAAGTPVVGGGGDQAAGAVGNGIVTTGVISATLGTSGVVFAFSDELKTDPEGRAHTFCHAVPGKWHTMGVILAAGGSFQWFRNMLGQAEMEEAGKRSVDPYEILTEEAARAEPGCEGLFFLPYLTGERTPHADPNARACWIGITPRTRKAELIRSLLEGATYAMRDSLEIIRDMGIPVEQIRVSGGGARSAFWRQLQADVYGHDVVTINASEGPAYGAALLAGVGAGVWKNVEEACQATIKITSTTEVNKQRAELYERHYQTFRSLYPALKGSFTDIAKLVD